MNSILLWVVVVVALGFDFTNGFHDTANAVATSVSTRALSPRTAVFVAAVANLAGAFVTTAVAKTVGKGIIDTGLATEKTVLAALLGAIALISVDAVSVEGAAEAVHLPTIILFFSFMVLSAQMRLGGFYDWVTRRLAGLALSPPLLLAALMGAVAALSAVLQVSVGDVSESP